MKHLKRSNYREETRRAINSYYCEDNESKIVKDQIDQTWERRERDEKLKILRETRLAWAIYNSIIDSDCLDDTIDIEEYLNGTDEVNDPIDPKEEVYSKSKKRAERRRATVFAKKRLIKKREDANKNLDKRIEYDEKNTFSHKSEGFDSRVKRIVTLDKRVDRFKR